MPNAIIHLHMSEDEFEVVKQLAMRWKLELQNSYDNIDEIFPLSMRDLVREDMRPMVRQAENICEALGCQTSSLQS